MRPSSRASKTHASAIDKMWVAYDIAVDASWQMAKNILKEPDADETEVSTAQQIINICTTFDSFIRSHVWLIHPGWAMSAGHRANDLMEKTFGLQEDGRVHPPFYTLGKGFALLCEDLIECFPTSKSAIEVWSSLKFLLEQVAGFVDWSADVNPDPQEFHDKLRAILLEGVEPPKEKQPKLEKLSLYEAFGDTVILAANRAEARAILQRVKGRYVTGKHLHGISPQEVFGDGRTGQDVIEQYRHAAPCVVGASV